MDTSALTAAAYRRFADHEAHGRSPLYEELARAISADPEVLELITALPVAKQQPNLILAAVRYRFGTARDWPQFRAWLTGGWDEVVEIIRTRATQTNEPARCATLLPLLATLPAPLALLEVGASAGLCLLPDRYAYDYGGHRVEPGHDLGVPVPTFSCRASPATPLPGRGLEVVWRAGLDLAPVDLADPEQVRWLETLVWPGEGERLPLLQAAVAVAQADPPPVRAGDLGTDLPALAAQAPKEATLVVFHSAVLAYVPPAARRRFADTVAGLDAVWIANEDPGLLESGPESRDPWPQGRFLMTRDRRPVAWNDPHGTATEWITGSG